MLRKILFVLVLILFLGQFSLWAFSASLEEILSNPKDYDGKSVIVEAEVVGEVLGNDQGGWINILEQGYNIGIFSSSKDMFFPIKHWGSYKEKGDIIRIEGVFYEDCLQHNISDIHLESLKIISPGFRKEDIVSSNKKKIAIGLFIICLTVNLIYLIKVRHERKT